MTKRSSSNLSGRMDMDDQSNRSLKVNKLATKGNSSNRSLKEVPQYFKHMQDPTTVYANQNSTASRCVLPITQRALTSSREASQAKSDRSLPYLKSQLAPIEPLKLSGSNMLHQLENSSNNVSYDYTPSLDMLE